MTPQRDNMKLVKVSDSYQRENKKKTLAWKWNRNHIFNLYFAVIETNIIVSK